MPTNITTTTSKKSPSQAEQTHALHSKRYIISRTQVDRTTSYKIGTAVALLKRISRTRFDPTVELHLVLTEKLRRTVNLPHGTGKKQTIVVFATGKAADDVKTAAKEGVTRVGGAQLVEEIKKNKGVHADLVLATPDMMPEVVKIAAILGPKGLMPNPKNNTITDDPAAAIQARAAGEIELKTEPNAPLLHLSIGKLSMDSSALQENIAAILSPLAGKIRKATLSSTMSPGLRLAL